MLNTAKAIPGVTHPSIPNERNVRKGEPKPKKVSHVPKIKSPSDTTLYAPALRRLGNKPPAINPPIFSPVSRNLNLTDISVPVQERKDGHRR